MKISELIKNLEAIKDKHGDIDTKVATFSHLFPPELRIVFNRDGDRDKAQYVLLND